MYETSGWILVEKYRVRRVVLVVEIINLGDAERAVRRRVDEARRTVRIVCGMEEEVHGSILRCIQNTVEPFIRDDELEGGIRSND